MMKNEDYSRDWDEVEAQDAFREKVKRAVRTGTVDERVDEELFRKWMEEGGRRRQIRRKWQVTLVVCLTVICLGTAGLNGLFEKENHYAVAGNHDPVTNEKDGNAVIKNNDVGAEENPGAEQIVVDDWEQVAAVKKQYPDLLIPGYVPEGYAFERLVVERTPISKSYGYIMKKGKDILEIRQTFGGKISIFYEYEEKIKIGHRKIYLDRGDRVNAGYKFEGSDILIGGKISEKELEKIILKYN